mmetsp:Transcript_7952/g.15993  ORF Transcript_7952/g.15993 Transcript_7952/m.15993 type:complete len:1059 (+) Transcript_7952:127-3303(+)
MEGQGKGCLEKGSQAINDAMEKFFGLLGYHVARFPRTVIALCLAFTVCCGLGFSKFVMLSDPEVLFTPSEANVVDDDRWIHWFWDQPQGVPEGGGRRLLAGDWRNYEIVGVEDGALPVVGGGEGGMNDQLRMYGFEHSHFSEKLNAEHPYAKLMNRDRDNVEGGERRNLFDVDYGEHPVIDVKTCHDDNVIMFRPDTASSKNFLEDNAKYIRLAIEIQLNLIKRFGYDKVCWDWNSKPRVQGVGECWGWSLNKFDADQDRIETLSKCIKHNRVLESTFMAGVEKDRNTGRLTQVTDLLVNVELNIGQPEIADVDDFIKSHENLNVHLGTIGWAGINNAIYAALLHDIPYILGPIFILLIYVSHIFYRPNRDSHMSLAFTGIANVFMAVISGIGITLAWGTGFTALHVCAVYITLGIGIDDAFIITAAVYNTEKQLGKFGSEEIERRVKIGMSRCGPSILLTSLTDFCAFFSNVSSNIFAIRNFSMVASIMVLIDFIFQVTFFISTLVMDMQRQEANRKDILCCFKRSGKDSGTAAIEDEGFNISLQNRKLSDYEFPANFGRSKSKESVISALSVGSAEEGGSFIPEGAPTPTSMSSNSFSSAGAAAAPPPKLAAKKEKYSQRIMNTVLYPVILNSWGKIAVLTATAVAIMIGFAGSSKLSIMYSPYLLIPSDSYMHENRNIMHEHFPWIMEESWTCVQTKEADYALYQQELLDLEKFICDNAARGQCFGWYGLFRVYVSAKYINDKAKLDSMLDSEELFHKEDFYRELKEFSLDTSMGGKATTKQMVRWKSQDEIIGSQMCFFWARPQSVPLAIDWMETKRREIKEIAPALNPSLFAKYFFSIDPLSTIVTDTLGNFTIISCVVLLVCLVILANVKATVLVLASVMTIEIIVLGSLHFFGMHFNMMTSIMLIVGVGLCVDFSAHSAHAFLHSKEHNPHDKVRDALDNVGISIWNGAFSSILAMLPMSLCKSYFVTTWWRVISLVIVLGIFYGLCVVPVLLTIFDDEDENDLSDWTIVSPEGKKSGASLADFDGGGGYDDEGVELRGLVRKEEDKGRKI